jgi:anti-sigma regulatory factor (Ser/Thr protein kinase)
MIAVTTHSRTRGWRYTVPMVVSGRRIQRELKDAPGCERYANIIAGPREFWTLTIWRDAVTMRKCMHDGTHGRVMWQQPHWLECYWGMRWRPGGYEAGEWEGNSWERPQALGLSSQSPQRPPAMLPWIDAALGRAVPLEQRQLAGAAGATYRLRVPPWGIPAALRDVRRLRVIAAADHELFRLSVGFGTGGALYLLVIATSSEALERLQSRPEHKRFLERWGDRAWCSMWEPESEFGHWESHKLRDGQLTAAPLLLDTGFPAEPDAARRARNALRARLQTCDSASLEVLQLLTSELVANSTRHAGLGPADRIGLQVRAKDEWIRVEVIDRGRRFEPRIPLSKSSLDGSGWGLFMVNQAASRWGVFARPPYRRVWFELRVPVPDHAAPVAADRQQRPTET